MEKQLNLSERLKSGTEQQHRQLDKRIMQSQPFADLNSYQGFLRMQLRLHAAAESLYKANFYANLLPGLVFRSRLKAVIADCHDLKIDTDLQQQDLQQATTINITNPYYGLGWLYTVEGSTMGAAMLLKQVKKCLQLSETFGARHMAAHDDGRVIHWREFKTLLDKLDLTELQQQQALDGAVAAFDYTINSVEVCMPEVVAST
ncbi:biliverdin-producing heme oxygenase [Catenovulum sp. 2E275]|uniref:biliverdin-producing heme oxygenase n=1 Tax=Catenovulum sp. 2E275 TaxID=2980497 RepID=UPI0021D2DB36|nr:biliverdin-producing heme oxygenase [Catenovulum sp. 2E275]MCU4675294.1 biliverdin-producing heme oxygenase [Catenovulum sp. 2E275]